MEPIQLTFTLLVCYQVKHFICDFPLQREYMMKKFLPGWEFLLPLITHAGTHSMFTLGILLIFAPEIWFFFIFDFVVHFTMDRLKSGPKYLGRFNDQSRPIFWWCFGLDQMVHHLTHYVIIYQIVTHTMN